MTGPVLGPSPYLCRRITPEALPGVHRTFDMFRLAWHLVAVSGGIVFWRNNETSAFLCAFVDCLDDVDEFLLVLEDPVEFVVVAGAEVTHHVFVAKEEHESDRVVEFVHLLEVGDLVEVTNVDDSEVLDPIGDLVENFILSHAIWIPVTTKTDHNKALVFGEDGLVDVPGGDQMGNNDRTHGDLVRMGQSS